MLKTSDPVKFFCDSEDDLTDVVGAGPFGDGELIRVVDPDGSIVWTEGTVVGAGSSVRWAMPGFQGEEYAACSS